MTEASSDAEERAARLARLQSRRPAPGPTRSEPARSAGRRRRRHPAAGARVAVAGLGVPATLGLVTAMALGGSSATAAGDQALPGTTSGDAGSGRADPQLLSPTASEDPPLVWLVPGGGSGSTGSGTVAPSPSAADSSGSTQRATPPTTSSTHGSR